MNVFGYDITLLDVPLWLTLIILEGLLSFDNAAILAAMVRKLPHEQRRKALLYGLAGAYVMRITAIFFVSVIIANPWLKIAGGAYLLWLAGKHFYAFARGESHEQHAEPKLLSRLGISSFWGVVIAVEFADLAFALDQVLVAVAMTPKVPVIIAASIVAILFLRISATYMARVMDWFPALETLAYAAVGFVGLKLIVVELAHRAHWCGPSLFCHEGKFEVPEWISFGVTLTLIVVPPLVKYVLELARGRNATPPAPPNP